MFQILPISKFQLHQVRARCGLLWPPTAYGKVTLSCKHTRFALPDSYLISLGVLLSGAPWPAAVLCVVSAFLKLIRAIPALAQLLLPRIGLVAHGCCQI